MKRLMFGDLDLPEGTIEQLELTGIPGGEDRSASGGPSDVDEEDYGDVELSSDSDVIPTTKEEPQAPVVSTGGDTASLAPETDSPEEPRQLDVRREYHFNTVGKDPGGEPIYRLSELYVPEDPTLKARIIAHNRRNLMGIREKTAAMAEGKARRKLRNKELQQRLANFYRTHKPRVFDEIELWLPNPEHTQCMLLFNVNEI